MVASDGLMIASLLRINSTYRYICTIHVRGCVAHAALHPLSILKIHLQKITVVNIMSPCYSIIRKVVRDMPKKPDESLKISSITGEQLKTYDSKLRANARYDQTMDSLKVRVPKGWKEQMLEYISQSDQYSSINGLICDLIRKEVGIEE